MSIKPIRDNLLTPQVLASGVKWDELEQVLVIALRKDGNILITSSFMKDRDLAYLCTHMQAFVSRYFNPDNKKNER